MFRFLNRYHARLSRHRRERSIEGILAAYAAGEERTAELRAAPAGELELALAAMLDVANGEARDRLSRLAIDLGFAGRWRAQVASRDPAVRRRAFSRLLRLSRGVADSMLMCALLDESEAVRLEAGRGLLAGGSLADAEAVFALALSQPPDARARLAPDLKPRALELAQRALPAALASPQPAIQLAALEFVAAWERALPVPELPALASHPNAAVRAAAIRALTYRHEPVPVEPLVMVALADPVPAVRAAACETAEKARPEGVLPALAARLEDEDHAVVRAAARALAAAGPPGLAVLDRELRRSWSPPLAAAALEAIERLKTENYGYARL
jgi:HEAT repeat protein